MTGSIEQNREEVRGRCQFCMKPLSKRSLGSLSGWIFQFNRCRCGTGHLGDRISHDEKTVEAIEEELPENYELLKIRGSGGMGWLLKVHDRKKQRDCALKLMKSELVGNPLARRRFEIEASTAMKLEHSNLVDVVDHGITSKGAPYLVMKYESGMSLAEIMEQEAFVPLQKALSIFTQICEGLIYSHSQGVIHRDIKPANIIVNDFHGEPLVKIVDFGIAYDSISGANLETITMTGEVVGSPQYMSPEQCRGEIVDHRTDIYSLGCVMYEVLTGHSPFAAPNPVKTILKQLNQKPSRFRTKFAFLKIPESMERIVFHCLEKRVDNRYQYMEELLRDLQSLSMGDKPVIASTQTRRRKDKKVSPLHLRLVSITYGVCVLSYVVYLSRFDTLTLLCRLFYTGIWTFCLLVCLILLIRLGLFQKELVSGKTAYRLYPGDGWLFLICLTFFAELSVFSIYSLYQIASVNRLSFHLIDSRFSFQSLLTLEAALLFVLCQIALSIIWIIRRSSARGGRNSSEAYF